MPTYDSDAKRVFAKLDQGMNAEELRTESTVTPEKDSLVCPHNEFNRDCIGCWSGHAERLENQLRTLTESTALPIRERVEKAIREQMEHCYQVYKGVPPTASDWVDGALHYVMEGLDRDIPLVTDKTSNRPLAK